MDIIITDHAYERRKRLGLNKKAFARLAERAYNDGVEHCNTNGRLNKLFTALYFKGTHANSIRIYGEFIYIFQNNILVTVFELNNKYKKYIK